MKTPHPAVLSRAMLFLILASLLFWVVVFLPIDNPGPPVVVYGSVVLGGPGLVAAPGLWNLKCWGIWLAMGVSVFSAFFGIGGSVSSSLLLTKALMVLPSGRQASMA
jgi:hypothetical protein